MRHVPDDEIDEQGAVIIAGIGRFGQIVNRLVQSSGFKTVVLDHDMATIQLMRRFGFKGFFGDPTRPELLHAAGLDKARVLVVALDDPDAANRLVTYARQRTPGPAYHRPRARPRPCVPAVQGRAPMTSCARCSTARCARAAMCWKTWG